MRESRTWKKVGAGPRADACLSHLSLGIPLESRDSSRREASGRWPLFAHGSNRSTLESDGTPYTLCSFCTLGDGSDRLVLPPRHCALMPAPAPQELVCKQCMALTGGDSTYCSKDCQVCLCTAHAHARFVYTLHTHATGVSTHCTITNATPVENDGNTNTHQSNDHE